ncbi:MAG: SpoIIE family protein phosphatase [Actinomycetota bacterium]|nr:SpoIIE family protein phosphatase [Actinomycetota bacterium]
MTVLAGHIPVLAVFALLRDVRPLHVLGEALLLAGPLLLALVLRGRTGRAVAASTGLMVSSAVLVHLSGGVVEAHFHYFVALTLVAVYQEWRVYAAAIGFVLVQHAVFSFLDPGAVFGHENGAVGWSLVHAGSVMALSAVLVVFWNINERAQVLRLEAEAGRLGDQRRVAQMVAEAPIGIARQGLDGTCIEANPALERILGRPAQELVGTRLQDLAHPDDRSAVDGALAQSVEAGASGVQHETRVLRPDGDQVWVLLTLSVLRDDDGRPAWLVAHVQDVTERRRAGDARLRIALDAAGMGTWDWDLRTGRVRGSEVVARMFGLSIMDDQRDSIMDCVHPEDATRLEAAHRRAIAELGVLDEQFRVCHPDGEQRWVHSRAAVLVAPDGEPALMVGVCQDRTQRRADEEERASLIDAQQRAADLAVRLQRLTAALAEAPTVEQVTRTLAASARQLPGAPASQVVVLDPERGLRQGAVAADRISDSLRDAARSGEAVWLPTAAARRSRYPSAAADGASVTLPLVSHGRTVGAWELSWSRARAFSAEEERFLGTAASLAATTLERARLFDEQREVAELLQRSLLPQRLPRVAGVEAAARYLTAGGAGSQVGGDWYDVLPLSDGRVGVVVGDVSGHGIRAASLMGQLRSTLRAYALEGRSPGEVLSAVDRALGGLGGIDPEQLATVTYAVLDPAHARLHYARAGHPPLLLVEPGGEPGLLDEVGGLPLGVDPDIGYGEATVVAGPGSRLLGYTDGLVERRDEALDRGLDRLVEAVRRAGDVPLAQLLDLLLDRLPTADHDDDVTLVGVGLAPAPRPPLAMRFPASYDQLPQLRERLGAWLTGAGADPESAQALMLAASEIATNAVDDAPDGAVVDVHVGGTVTGDQACVTIRHPGHAVGERGIDRGRGLMLVEALAERFEVHRTPDGSELRISGALKAHTQRTATTIRLP